MGVYPSVHSPPTATQSSSASSAWLGVMPLLNALLAGALAFAGAMVGHWFSRLTAREQERWRRREETMRLVRWGAELAVSERVSPAILGLTALDALADSPLVDRDDLPFIYQIGVAATLSYTQGQEVRDDDTQASPDDS